MKINDRVTGRQQLYRLILATLRDPEGRPFVVVYTQFEGLKRTMLLFVNGLCVGTLSRRERATYHAARDRFRAEREAHLYDHIPLPRNPRWRGFVVRARNKEQ